MKSTSCRWIKACLGIVIVAFCVWTPLLLQAEGTRLVSIGVRGGLSGSSPIGEIERERFRQYDVLAMVGLPWEWYRPSGWGVGTRLLVSAGALTAAGQTGFVGSLLPGLSLGKKDGWVSFEAGAGAALLSRYIFGSHSMGGPFQFVWEVGIRSRVYRCWGIGYWFQHMSDATIYREKGIGVDLHVIEAVYRY